MHDDTRHGPPRARVVFCAYLFCAVTGLGIGAFCSQPTAGLLAGVAVAVVAGHRVALALADEMRRNGYAPASVRLGGSLDRDGVSVSRRR